jgi:hypothetical protein
MDHFVGAAICLGATALAIIVSVITAWPDIMFRMSYRG